MQLVPGKDLSQCAHVLKVKVPMNVNTTNHSQDIKQTIHTSQDKETALDYPLNT